MAIAATGRFPRSASPRWLCVAGSLALLGTMRCGDPTADPPSGLKDASSERRDASSGALDAGNGALDAGNGALDAGSGALDAGSVPMDSGSPPRDAGSVPMDSGSPPRDAGSVPMDSGSPPRDAAVVSACPSLNNPPGTLRSFTWPAPSNTGNRVDPGQTLRFVWTGTHNVIEQAGWDSPFTDPGWPNAIRSSAPRANSSFDWNVGTFPCGYRPGLYYFVDQGNAVNGVVAVSVTDNVEAHYAPRACSRLNDTSVYEGRYARFGTRTGCTQYEVNNFRTEPHYDWVQPTFGAKQGDLVLFRWTGSHNVVQVHDVHQDTPVGATALNSGPPSNCVGGPNYSCANGPITLGEFLIDTQNYRPGMIHISDECAYNRVGCRYRRPGPESATGMNMQFLLSRPDGMRPTVSAPGACCALDRTKGQACRVVDVYNDNAGSQFDYNVGVNRGDLVRFRWHGTIRLVQTTPNTNGSPSRNPKPGGIAMASPVECVPGPNWTCVNGTTAQAQLVLDVNREVSRGNVNPGNQFTFQAYGENTDGYSSQDSGVLLWVDNAQPYASNPACP